LDELREKPYFETNINYIKDNQTETKRAYSNIELVFKYMRGLNMIKLFIL